MGLIDTCVLVSLERRRRPLSFLARQLAAFPDSEKVAVSAVTVAELVAGIHRAKQEEQGRSREWFVKEVQDQLEVVPFTLSTAAIAGRVRGEQAALGNNLPPFDSLIAAAALELQYSILTLNLADFRRVPGLSVIAYGA